MLRAADSADLNKAKVPKRADVISALGPKSDYDTDVEQEDEEDGRVKWFRYKCYMNLLEGWEAFLSGTIRFPLLFLNSSISQLPLLGYNHLIPFLSFT